MNKKRVLATALLLSITSMGCALPQTWASDKEELPKYSLAEYQVDAEATALPGGFVSSKDRVGILGNIDVIDVPFSQTRYTEKTITTFDDPNQPLNGILSNNPSIRIGTTSPMYTDFSMRGVNMNASHYYLNGIPNLFNQTRSLPTYVLDSVEVVSGPNTVLNGATFSNNGTNGTDAPAGMLSATTKKATATPQMIYTQTFSGQSTLTENLDMGQRFGKNNEWGVRVNLHKAKGGLSMDGAELDDKTIYINIDHQDAKSATNLFAGYYDWRVDGGQRWLSATNVKNGKLAAAPGNANNVSFDGQTKYNYGYLMTLNHVQKFSDKWTGFVNIGYGEYTEHKNDPNSGSLTLGDNGKLTGTYRDYRSNSISSYWQIGVSNKAEIGKIKNNLSFAVDYFTYKSKAINTGSAKGQATITGDIWNGVHVVGNPIYAGSLDSVGFSDERAIAATLANRTEFGKFSLYLAAQYRKTTTQAAGKDSVSKGSLNPTVAVAYKPIDNLSIYTSYAQSYTKHVVVGKDYINADEIFAPIKNQQTEIGIKYKAGTMLHGLAIFDLNQGSYIVEATPAGDMYTQNGENRFKGIEYTFVGSLTKKWNIMGGLTYLHGVREKNTKASAYKDGWRATGTPHWNGVLAAEYEADQNTSLIGRINFTSASLVNDNNVEAPSFYTVDLGARYKTKLNSLPFTASLMVYNVFGRDYWISRGTSVCFGAPRTVVLSGQFTF